MKIIIETDRLLLREIFASDRNGLFAIDSDPDVNIYLGNNPVKNIEQTDDIIQFIRKQYVDNGIGRWAMIEKGTNNFIGWTGLKFITDLTNNHKNYYDLGYRLNKNYWGKGFATEAATASLNYAFEKLKTEEVFAMADCKNVGSNNILNKVGLHLIEKFDLDGVEHNWYKINKNEYDIQTRNK